MMRKILFLISYYILSLIKSTEYQLFRTGYEPHSSECMTTVDNRIGFCMPKAECISSCGYVANTCNSVLYCCVYQGTCKSVITANETYFVSPPNPALHSERLDPPLCIFTLQQNASIIKWSFCQIRLEGEGLCGELTGQHIYLDVDPKNTDEPLLLIVNTANDQHYNREWSIRIQQIPCQSPFRAPSGSLQYYTTSSGTIESLNFRGIGIATPVLLPGQLFPPIIPGQHQNKHFI